MNYTIITNNNILMILNLIKIHNDNIWFHINDDIQLFSFVSGI